MGTRYIYMPSGRVEFIFRDPRPILTCRCVHVPSLLQYHISPLLFTQSTYVATSRMGEYDRRISTVMPSLKGDSRGFVPLP